MKRLTDIKSPLSSHKTKQKFSEHISGTTLTFSQSSDLVNEGWPVYQAQATRSLCETSYRVEEVELLSCLALIIELYPLNSLNKNLEKLLNSTK